MRASFEPTALQIAILFGWTVFGTLRDRFERFRGRAPLAVIPVENAPRPTPPPIVPARRVVDYSIN